MRATDGAPPAPAAVGELGPRLTRELWAWSAIAVGALAVAGVFALFLAISRIPGIETLVSWPIDFFHKGLVIHVVFSFVVWFLAAFGALLVLATHAVSGRSPRLAALGSTAALLMAVAMPLLFVPALLDRGEATLNDYIPVIIDPLYYAGLLLMAIAMAMAATRLFVNLGAGARALSGGIGMLVLPVAGAALMLVMALVSFAAAYGLLAGEAPSHPFNEDLMWGGGHLLQFVNTQLLLAAWMVLAGFVLGRDVVGIKVGGAATAFLAAPTLLAPLLYLMFAPFSVEQAEAFTNLQYALAPPALLVAGCIALRWSGGARWREPAFLCLLLSALVFAVGGVFGLFVDGADTRTPGHYHGVIAGVTLAFMGLFYVLILPALGRAIGYGKIVYVQIYLFAGGQLAACIGLFLAGGFGTPRKAAGAGQGLEAMGAIAGMALNGAGALIAVIGGVLFIWTIGSALLSAPARR